MNLLIADTTDKALTVIAVKGDKIYKYFSADNARHNADIIPAINTVLTRSGMSVKDIHAFSAVTGPGSFTGIRIGVSVMNAFSDVTGAKLIGISAFEMIGNNAANAIVLIDARNGNYYGAEIKDAKIIKSGNYKEADIDLSLLRKIYRKNIDYSDNLISIARDKYNSGAFVTRLSPLYMKASQAERELISKNYIIRKMDESHLDDVLEIERQSFITPWTKEMYLESLSNGDARGYVVESGGEILGYALILQIYDEMHIMRIAIKSAMRRQGYGEKLLRRIIDETAKLNINTITLEVRESNISAKTLYEKFNFECTGLRKNYYEGKENAIIYSLELGR
ncbi:MAG: ribosomal protein S18-alanine N-acetyltransferase [Christensenellales bacterium]|jgi:ribosomal-protein-alanine N-acetyltransferase